MLRFLAALPGRTSEHDQLRHSETHSVLDDFGQGDVGDSKIADVGHERPVRAAAAGI